jgi:serine/threonine protein kinase
MSPGVISARRFVLLQREHRAATVTLEEKVKALQLKSSEQRAVNDELMRQIDQRSRRLLDAMLARLHDDSGDRTAGIAPITTGTLLSDAYRVVRAIGAGGFGTVYEVERIPDGQRLAAKVVSSDANRHALLRFGREA